MCNPTLLLTKQMEPKTHKYFSIPAKYNGSLVEDLELNIQKYGDNVVRMQLLNRVHKKQCGTQLKRFLLLAGLATVYYGFVFTVGEDSFKIQQAHILYPGMLWLIFAYKILRSTLDLVHSEKLFYSWDMALQTETVRTFGRKSVFCVQRGHLHDIVLNEVIENVGFHKKKVVLGYHCAKTMSNLKAPCRNLDIKYMLILRTKGSMFTERPIIPLFNSLSPSFECLKHIQLILHGYWLNNNLNKEKDA